MMSSTPRLSITAYVSIILILLFLPCGASAGGLDPGDYAGWAYLPDGGDFPLRLHYSDDAEPRILLSFPHLKAFDLSTQGIRLDEDTLLFERRNAKGRLWRYELTRTGDALVGTAVLENDDTRYEFELHHANESLVSGLLADHDDHVGIFRSQSGRTLVISAWFWGELRFFDTDTGRTGTLFQTERGDFIVGSALYVPAPVFARLRFERDAAGSVTKLVYSQAGEATVGFSRFEVTEHIVPFQSGDAHLEGTLLKPLGAGPFPTIVVLGGSGWETRNHVRRQADIFASLGLATFIYDKRGSGKSGGDPTMPFARTAGDACAAIRALKRRPEVYAKHIGIHGVSRSGWLAPLAATQCADDVSFLVLFVAPAISPAKQETTRRLSDMRAAGYNNVEIVEATAHLKLLMNATESEADWARYVPERDRLADRPWLEEIGRLDSRDTDDYRWCKLNMHYDPVPTLTKVACPLLAFYGQNDDNVTPEENIPLMRAALQQAGNSDFKIVVLPRADHGLHPVDPGVRLPIHRTTGYVPQVWPTVRDWLRARCFSTRPSNP